MIRKAYKIINLVLVLALSAMPSVNMYASQKSHCNMPHMATDKTMQMQDEISTHSPCHHMLQNSKIINKCNCDAASCHCMVISHVFITSLESSTVVSQLVVSVMSPLTEHLTDIYIPASKKPPIV